jgi:hypothetical protein
MDRKLIVLASLMVLLLFAMVFLIGIAIGTGSQGNLGFAGDSLSSWVSALATAVIAVLTIVLAKETWELRRLQITQIEQIRRDAIKPSIAVVLKASSVGISFMNVHVANNGSGLAQNIRFFFSNQNPDAQDVFDYISEQIEGIAFMSDGISSMAPGQELSSFFLNFIDLNGKFPEDHAFNFHCTVRICYADLEGTEFESNTTIRFAELKGISKLGTDPTKKLADSVEKIQKDMHSIMVGLKRIRTDVYTSDDREKERQELEQDRAAMNAPQN